jgi:hypothetical protein
MAGQARGDQTMSATLTEFLREQAEKRKGKMAERQGVLDEWVEALNRLYDTVREWLREADPDGVLAVKTAEWKVTEEELGTYAAPRIDIHGLGRWVGFVPKARHTVGTATPPAGVGPGSGDRPGGHHERTPALHPLPSSDRRPATSG